MRARHGVLFDDVVATRIPARYARAREAWPGQAGITVGLRGARYARAREAWRALPRATRRSPRGALRACARGMARLVDRQRFAVRGALRACARGMAPRAAGDRGERGRRATRVRARHGAETSRRPRPTSARYARAREAWRQAWYECLHCKGARYARAREAWLCGGPNSWMRGVDPRLGDSADLLFSLYRTDHQIGLSAILLAWSECP